MGTDTKEWERSKVQDHRIHTCLEMRSMEIRSSKVTSLHKNSLSDAFFASFPPAPPVSPRDLGLGVVRKASLKWESSCCTSRLATEYGSLEEGGRDRAEKKN